MDERGHQSLCMKNSLMTKDECWKQTSAYRISLYFTVWSFSGNGWLEQISSFFSNKHLLLHHRHGDFSFLQSQPISECFHESVWSLSSRNRWCVLQVELLMMALTGCSVLAAGERLDRNTPWDVNIYQEKYGCRKASGVWQKLLSPRVLFRIKAARSFQGLTFNQCRVPFG